MPYPERPPSQGPLDAFLDTIVGKLTLGTAGTPKGEAVRDYRQDVREYGADYNNLITHANTGGTAGIESVEEAIRANGQVEPILIDSLKSKTSEAEFLTKYKLDSAAYAAINQTRIHMWQATGKLPSNFELVQQMGQAGYFKTPEGEKFLDPLLANADQVFIPEAWYRQQATKSGMDLDKLRMQQTKLGMQATRLGMTATRQQMDTEGMRQGRIGQQFAAHETASLTALDDEMIANRDPSLGHPTNKDRVQYIMTTGKGIRDKALLETVQGLARSNPDTPISLSTSQSAERAKLATTAVKDRLARLPKLRTKYKDINPLKLAAGRAGMSDSLANMFLLTQGPYGRKIVEQPNLDETTLQKMQEISIHYIDTHAAFKSKAMTDLEIHDLAASILPNSPPSEIHLVHEALVDRLYPPPDPKTDFSTLVSYKQWLEDKGKSDVVSPIAERVDQLLTERYGSRISLLGAGDIPKGAPAASAAPEPTKTEDETKSIDANAKVLQDMVVLNYLRAHRLSEKNVASVQPIEAEGDQEAYIVTLTEPVTDAQGRQGPVRFKVLIDPEE